MCRRNCLQLSKRDITSGSSDTRLSSRFTSFRALLRLVDATDDCAIACSIAGFSFSRLKPLRLFFFSFLLDLPKLNVGPSWTGGSVCDMLALGLVAPLALVRT